MKIKSITFVKSVAQLHQLPNDQIPQIAFAGRSNVGKSSLMNVLFNRKKMALVSSTPGKTRLLNFFLVNEKYYFVDLPGYGYAKVSKQEKSSWQKLIENYLSRCQNLKIVVVLIDIRHQLQKMDKQLFEWLSAAKLPFIIVGTKADKLSKSVLNKQLVQFQKESAIQSALAIIPFSSVTRDGRSILLQTLEKNLN